MMPKLMKQFMEFVGFDTQEEEDVLELDNEPVAVSDTRTKTVNPLDKRSKVVNIHTTAQLKVVVMSPMSFDEARDVADYLKTKNPVVINLETLPKDSSRRMVDFLSGAVYALGGSIQKIANGIFLATPYNVSILGDFKDELKRGGWSL